jgi:hypothetical protein
MNGILEESSEIDKQECERLRYYSYQSKESKRLQRYNKKKNKEKQMDQWKMNRFSLKIYK